MVASVVRKEEEEALSSARHDKKKSPATGLEPARPSLTGQKVHYNSHVQKYESFSLTFSLPSYWYICMYACMCVPRMLWNSDFGFPTFFALPFPGFRNLKFISATSLVCT